MDLYTNENNTTAFKIVIASEFANKPLSIHMTNFKADPLIPYLKTSTGYVYSGNAALWYILSNYDEDPVDEWAEWVNSVLDPFLSEPPVDDKTMLEMMKYLNLGLFGRDIECSQMGVNAAQISILAVLYPIYEDEESRTRYLSQHPGIVDFLTIWLSKDQFKNALKRYNVAPFKLAQTAFMNDGVVDAELKAVEKAWNMRINKIPILKTKKGISLPVKGETNVLITSALPYVNNVPHLGNIIGCVLSADVFARYCRLCNFNTLFICGTDEYGTATETKALEEGITCQELCDKYFKLHDDIYKWFNISFDHFGRTSTPNQTELCQKLFLELSKNGFIFLQSVEQLFCCKCKRYLADRFVEGHCPHPGCKYEDARGDQCDGCGKLINAIELKEPKCKLCRSKPEIRSSEHFFLDLPKLEPLLYHWSKKTAENWSTNAQIICRSWMKDGLKPRCITRDLDWGVSVPLDGYRKKVFYVWFDAPVGYMSITKSFVGSTENWDKWWRPGLDMNLLFYQFMAKDNVPFHGIVFPAALLGANNFYSMVTHIVATEYLKYEDGKFSKSRGVGVFGNDARDSGIPNDVWRFYLLYVRPESQDSNFSWPDLALKNNTELLNNLGNFINRALAFVKNNFDRKVPPMCPSREDLVFLVMCARELKSYHGNLMAGRLRAGLRCILAISKLANQYMQSNQPWVLVKAPEGIKRAAGATVIGICCNVACLLSLMMHPYMPDSSAKLQQQLNIQGYALDPKQSFVHMLVPAGHIINEPYPLFTKIETEQVHAFQKKFSGVQTK